MHLFVIPWQITYVWICTATLIAYWKGGWRERAIVSIILLEAMFWLIWVLTVGELHPQQHRLWRAAGDDLLTLAVCIGCALRAHRYWVIWASSIALANLTTDLLGLIPGVSLWASISGSLVWSYLLCAIVIWGALSFDRDRRCPSAAMQSM